MATKFIIICSILACIVGLVATEFAIKRSINSTKLNKIDSKNQAIKENVENRISKMKELKKNDSTKQLDQVDLSNDQCQLNFYKILVELDTLIGSSDVVFVLIDDIRKKFKKFKKEIIENISGDEDLELFLILCTIFEEDLDTFNIQECLNILIYIYISPNDFPIPVMKFDELIALCEVVSLSINELINGGFKIASLFRTSCPDIFGYISIKSILQLQFGQSFQLKFLIQLFKEIYASIKLYLKSTGSTYDEQYSVQSGLKSYDINPQYNNGVPNSGPYSQGNFYQPNYNNQNYNKNMRPS